VVALYGDGRRENDYERTPERADEIGEDPFMDLPRLGQDVRFVLACVGGGAIQIGREVARRHLRYVETVAINCDPSVQDREEFDRRVCLGTGRADTPDIGGSPSHGAQIARAAMPALERLFEGSTFVTVVGSLGGGAGTGVLPYVLDAAARSSQVLSVFVVKPFHCEGDRRAVADRALARLHFIESYVEKQERGSASLQVLDNEFVRASEPTLPFHRLNARWAEQIARHIEGAFIVPAETVLEAHRSQAVLGTLSPARPPAPEPAPTVPHPFAPLASQLNWDGGPTGLPSGDAELTFEVDGRPEGPLL
jgi:hypothetical protein